LAERKSHLSQSPTGKSRGGGGVRSGDHGGQEVDPPPLFDRSIAQTTAYSRMLLPHYCECVVTLRHVEKHLVCLEVAGALTTTSTCRRI
jgi:hypothetical protein